MPEPVETLQAEEKSKQQEAEEEVYLEWRSPSRPFKKRDRQWFIRLGTIVLIVSLGLIFFKQFLLVLVIFALTFVAYVLSTVEPELLEHRITSNGVTTAGKSHLYKELKDFYFTQKSGQEILNIEVKGKVPSILAILLGDQDKKTVEDFLKKHLPFREVAPVFFADKLFEYTAKKLKLD